MDADIGDMEDFEGIDDLDAEGGPEEAGSGGELDVEQP